MSNNIIFEFSRYILVGGIAFLVDLGVLVLFSNYILFGQDKFVLFVSTALGFISGLIVNYLLSLLFVFRSDKDQKMGWTLYAFLMFAVIGIIGLVLTELGMNIGVFYLGMGKVLTKIIVASIVLVWNYGARKVIIFR